MVLTLLHDIPIIEIEVPDAPREPLIHLPHGTRTAAGGFAAIRQAFYALLDGATFVHRQQLREAICAGQIDGAAYTGTSRCVLGWLGRGIGQTETSYLVEGFVYSVLPGQTPDTNGRLRRLMVWLAAWELARKRTRCLCCEVKIEPESATVYQHNDDTLIGYLCGECERTLEEGLRRARAFEALGPLGHPAEIQTEIQVPAFVARAASRIEQVLPLEDLEDSDDGDEEEGDEHEHVD